MDYIYVRNFRSIGLQVDTKNIVSGLKINLSAANVPYAIGLHGSMPANVGREGSLNNFVFPCRSGVGEADGSDIPI